MSTSRRWRRTRAPFGIGLLALLLTACGVSPTGMPVDALGADGADGADAGGTGIGIPGTPVEDGSDPDGGPELRPPVDLEVHGKVPSRVNEIATTTIADLEEWWSDEYPRVFGDEYEPLGGGLYAYDSGSDTADLPCLDPNDDIALYLHNAFYCFDTDSVFWDQEFLLPYFADAHGEFAVSILLAHEWGHVIQADHRSRVRASSIVMDLQADCYAGAWARHARDTDRPHFEVDSASLDSALAALLEIRDDPGGDAGDEGAHGSGFDRVNAFQDGYLNGAASCAEYSNETVTSFLFPFADATDQHFGGDMPLEEIKEAAFDSLEAYWADTYPTLSGGEPWPGLDAVEFSERNAPRCDGDVVTGYRLFLCWPDRYVGFSTEAARAAYESGTGDELGGALGGDFAVATLFATQYGLGVQLALGHDLATDPVLATLRGDCFAGAWGADLIETPTRRVPDRWRLRLSPGDLDEGIGALLGFRTESDLERQGPGFDRVTAFRTGVLGGPAECVTHEPAGTG